ncbi:hypothetical protein [Streptomyces sp. NPDC001037]|uniref:hypothetical protein n=1 Tax=Streptomyces sp. NPDC001037 TaxID=3364542 RepID=UPI0036BDF68D
MLYVVTGLPTSGESSWIQAHATARDIVIDLDLITRALSGPGAPQWNQHPTQLRVAHHARYAAMDTAFELCDKVDVYLIHTMPTARAMAKHKRLKALWGPGARHTHPSVDHDDLGPALRRCGHMVVWRSANTPPAPCQAAACRWRPLSLPSALPSHGVPDAPLTAQGLRFRL